MKKILLYILTISMLLTSSVFTNVATALVRTTGTNSANGRNAELEAAGYTPISTEAQFRAMASGTSTTQMNKYYLTNDIVITQYYKFPMNIILDGNGHALLPPEGTSESNPLRPGIYDYSINPDTNAYDHSNNRILKHCNPTRGTRPSTQTEEIKGEKESEAHWNQGIIPRHTYETVCLFTFTTQKYHNVTFQNLSFGTSQRPFWMEDDCVNGLPERKNTWAGLALFCTNEYVSNLTCENVDFHVRLNKPRGSGNMAGFMSVVYNNTSMINCNMDAEILGENITNQAGCFFAQTSRGDSMTLLMENCTVLAGSLLKKNGQTGGMVGQVSGTATFIRCTNYCDLVQTEGYHAGGIAANLFQGGWNITFDKCINYGTIYAMRAAGGICGAIIGDSTKNSSKTVKATFTNCLNAADIRPIPAKEVKDANGTVTSTTYYGESCGGILGTYHSFAEITIDSCVNLGIIHAPEKETSKNGYFHASIGQFIGAIGHLYAYVDKDDAYECQCTNAATAPMVDKKDTNGNVVKDDQGNPIKVRNCTCGTNKHPYYTTDEQWTWHYTYDAIPATIKNSYAMAELAFGSNCAKINPTTGLDQAGTKMGMGSLPHITMVGCSVPLNLETSINNKNPDRLGLGTGELAPGSTTVYIIKAVNTRSLMQTLAKEWLVTNGFVERLQIDYPNLAIDESTHDDPDAYDVLPTTPYVIGTPKVAALLSSSEHDNVRIVATINSYEYKQVGFNYSFYVYNEQWTEEIRTKPLGQWKEESRFGSVNYWTTAIYENVGALRTADELGGQYLYEMTLLNMPRDKIVRFDIIPKVKGTRADYFYSQNKDGSWSNRDGELLGQRYNLYFYNGELVRCEISDPYKT